MTGFEPSEHFMKLKGKDYLPVAWRLVWFREEHPDWGITTEIVEHNIADGVAVVRAAVYNGSDSYTPPLASGHKMETRKDFPDYLEKAETGAIGRALAALGYGTQFALELEEGVRIVDSPVEKKAYVPTDVREVEDADVVRSADDKDWKAWQRGRKAALDLHAPFTELELPQPREKLVAGIRALAVAVRARNAELDKMAARSA